MAQIREIKKRMTAVSTIQRITKTMQMIATATFNAAVGRAKATQPYTQTIRELVAELAASTRESELDHPLLSAPSTPVRRELLLVICSDRGLCGAYNANVLRRAMNHIRACREDGIEIDLEISGKKAVSYFKFQRVPMTHQHAIGDKPAYEDVEQLATRYMDAFSDRRYDAVRVAYMRFESNTRQIPELMQLLPLEPESGDGEQGGPSANYEFSPSEEELLASLLPLSVKSQLFQAFNDAVVSEQIMRMVAMKAATENAKDIGRRLNRDFNRARQSEITTELSEIISGSAALE
jgi:F-type H+-transporting ATPase subunit gamma